MSRVERIEKIVEITDTASQYGSGLLKVFATPAMIALMEGAAHKLAKSIVSENEDTVGTEVNIKHLRATPVGVTVYAEAELIERDERRLTFRVVAFDDNGEIGNGTHTRFIISPEKFMKKIS
jgi:Predicted thioesterase